MSRQNASILLVFITKNEFLISKEKLLAYNPDERLTAKEALRHPYFRDLYEQDKRIHYAMNTGPRGTFTNSQRSLKPDSDINSDAASVTDHNNISQISNHINININTNSSSNNHNNINISFMKNHRYRIDKTV
jgi:hypothetical protein